MTKIRRAAQKRSHNPIWRANLLAAVNTPQEKIRRSKSLRRAWSKPSVRKRWVQSIRRAWSKTTTRKHLSKAWYKYQKKVKLELETQGWKVIDRGWPDFICIRGRKIRFIEAKAPKGKLSTLQETVHKIFNKLGIQVEVIRPVQR